MRSAYFDEKFERRENSNFSDMHLEAHSSWRISASSSGIESRWESVLLEMSLVRRVRQKSQELGGRKLAKQSRAGKEEEEEQNESGRRRWTKG